MSLDLSSGKCKKTAIQTRGMDSRFHGNDDSEAAHREGRHPRESGNPPLGLVQCLQLQRKTSERAFPNFLALPGQTSPGTLIVTNCRSAARQ